MGLREILAELYAEGKKADLKIGDEIIDRLETKGNFIPPGIVVRREYSSCLRQEFEEYVDSMKSKNR